MSESNQGWGEALGHDDSTEIHRDRFAVCPALGNRQRSLKSQFVENHLRKIRKSDVTFRYIQTRDNPADLATGRLDPKHLAMSLLWWKGSHWLRKEKKKWP